jgi:hypothetical protein
MMGQPNTIVQAARVYLRRAPTSRISRGRSPLSPARGRRDSMSRRSIGRRRRARALIDLSRCAWLKTCSQAKSS